MRKEAKSRAIVALRWKLIVLEKPILRCFFLRDDSFTCGRVIDVTVQGKGVASVLNLRVITCGNGGIGGPQRNCIAFVSTKLYLSRGMCGQHFVQAKIERIIIKLGNQRRQMNSL